MHFAVEFPCSVTDGGRYVQQREILQGIGEGNTTVHVGVILQTRQP